MSLASRTLDLACAIQQIPAPTFAEHQRAAFVRDMFTQAGLSKVSIDDLGNVYGCLPGTGRARPLLVTGHTGFKGSWLALWLHKLGAVVTGVARPASSSFFKAASLSA